MQEWQASFIGEPNLPPSQNIFIASRAPRHRAESGMRQTDIFSGITSLWTGSPPAAQKKCCIVRRHSHPVQPFAAPVVCTQVPKYVILTDLPRYAAIAFTVIFFCTCSGGLNILQSESLIISSTAMRGKIPCLWQVRATEISTEKTSLPSGSESW